MKKSNKVEKEEKKKVYSIRHFYYFSLDKKQ